MKLTKYQLTLLDEIVDKSLDFITESSAKQEAYKKYFKEMLKKFGVTSPNQLKGEKKKQFFAAVKAGWAKQKK